MAITLQPRIQSFVSMVISTVWQSADGLESRTTDVAGLTTHTKPERNGNGSMQQTVLFQTAASS